MRSNPNATEEQKALFIMEAATEADSRLFKLFMEYREMAESQTSKEKVAEKIKLACQNTVKKSYRI